MSQFFYTRTEGEKSFLDSFNTEKVIRTIGYEDGTRLVLLDDLHERAHEVPDVDPKSRIVKGMKRVRDIFQSEILLSKEDAEKFINTLK
jgi:hypothetical protein